MIKVTPTSAKKALRLLNELKKAATLAELKPGAQEIGSRWGQEVAELAVAGGHTAFFEAFCSKATALLHKEESNYTDDVMQSGIEREAESREELRASGVAVGMIGMLIGTAAGRAGSPRDAEHDHLLGSSPGGALVGSDGKKWLWEHKEITPQAFGAMLKQVRPRRSARRASIE